MTKEREKQRELVRAAILHGADTMTEMVRVLREAAESRSAGEMVLKIGTKLSHDMPDLWDELQRLAAQLKAKP